MAFEQKGRPGGECESPNLVEDSLDWDIPIYPAGDEASLHIRNDPNDPYQRDRIIHRPGKVHIGCTHADVVHGYLTPDCNDLYTLIVLDFRFHPNGIARRIKEAWVKIKFAGMEMGRPDPEVVQICPDGLFCVEPTRQNEQLVKGAGLNIGGGVTGAQVGGDCRLERIVERETVHHTRVRGSIDLTRNYGPDDAVSWTLLENPTTKTGVVSSLRGVILLKRKSMERFKARVTLKAKVDTATTIGSMFENDPEDDDVWYDPNKAPTNRLHKYDVDSLKEVDLESLSKVIFRQDLDPNEDGK
ncbi:hypothetical protein ASPWEDRAFT_36636 [Aspergillus wentii DTO 134E9]|uniref:Uncharacterized protein n=1 Tax=Aspergillus wentii DTO 134E9 TaxID=1073089 RepID=A0A1L9RVI9_ASPWE|nr:uncharacterized protein ASPWEDRAFT_36636 [Aspergillus wentii DTO 134E9]KAI9928835.1 hypothetical protein MW887_002056 [Aspergillus wentii]OJJ38936.1 hypothetical protein ASPWEDRAFT_36636 [Aspergillus wentii DTO 134E9]